MLTDLNFVKLIKKKLNPKLGPHIEDQNNKTVVGQEEPAGNLV